jgi:hypothetical protein
MKTKTYARLALLIPLLIWVILIFVELVFNLVIPADLRSSEQMTVFGLLEMFIMFYVMGILFWFLPYLVLSIALLLISFTSRLKMLQYLFILSPFAMAILAMLEGTIITLSTRDLFKSSADILSNFIISTSFSLMMGILALVYGYICVGIGFGGYKLLQRFGMIVDEEKANPEIIRMISQEA